MDNKDRKLFAINQNDVDYSSYTSKMHQSTPGSWDPPEPTGGAYALPHAPQSQWGPTSKGEGREERGGRKGGEGIPPQSQGE